MTMKPANAPDIAVAQDWIAQLDAYVRAHGLRGFDPFDVKQHPLIQRAQTQPFLRRATTVLTDMFPHASRSLLGIQPTENPKAFALVALGSFRMYQLTEEARYLEQGLAMLDWLRAHAAPGHAGLCWGYPFHVHATGLDSPPGTPVGVVSSIAGLAFARAFELTNDRAHGDAARSICDFMLRDLPRMEEDDGTCCFGYTPGDRRRVHNANLLAAEHLMRTWALTGEQELYDAAQPAIAFTVKRQREDGAWPYGEHRAGEPFEAGLMRLVDNHHTGFVLRSLHGIHAAEKRDDLKQAIQRGWQFYRTLFTKTGRPLTEHAKWPVDIHACAEGILCTSVLSDMIFSTRRPAFFIMRWPHYHLRNRDDGAPWYRAYPFFTSRICYPRWGLAWMYWALAEYLFHFYRDEDLAES